MLIFGKNVIYEALKANHRIKEFFLKEGTKDAAIIEASTAKNIKITYLSNREMDSKFSGVHQGYGALASDFRLYNLDEVTESGNQRLLLLDKIQDPHNFGAILRCADAFGVDGVIYSKDHSASITDTVIKVSTGAIFYTRLVPVTNLNQAIETLKKRGFWIIGMDGEGSSELQDIRIDAALAIVIGSEGNGISKLSLKKCDYICKIPMQGHVNSLNASVSAGITLALIRSLEKR